MYVLTITLGTHKFHYKATTISELYEAILDAAEVIGKRITNKEDLMCSLVNLKRGIAIKTCTSWYTIETPGEKEADSKEEQ